MILPWIAFLAWVPISLYCFQRYSVRVALLINFFAGWALLPAALYTPTTAIFPYWILGGSLPSDHFLTKASVTAITASMGVLFQDRAVFRRFQFSLFDLPMIAWCAVPLLSALANSQQPIPALRGEAYQCLAWGVPYLLGRLYFTDSGSLLMAAKAIVLVGMAYIPICLMEIVTGPQIYAFLYGYEPYRWVGAQRYLGFRPVGLMEDGNQLGIWMASSALIAVWLWRHRLVNAILNVPIAWIAGSLFVVTMLCQSAGSIVLLLCLLFFAFARHKYLPRVLAAVLLAGMVAAVGLRLANVVSLRSLVAHNPVAYEIARDLKEMRLGTFGWRLSQDERYVTTALKTPMLGSSQWDWWRGTGPSRPWSLWLLGFGMYGLVGLLGLECLQLLPVVRAWRTSFAAGHRKGSEVFTALAAVVLMSAVDNLLNGSMILPLVLVIGGMSGPGQTYAAAAGDWFRRSRDVFSRLATRA